MITAIIYFIDGLILSIFCYKLYHSVSGKITKNPFTFYFLWALFFPAVNAFYSAICITIAIIYPTFISLSLINVTARTLFYIGSIFAVQIPLYKYFPKSRWRYVFSYMFGAVGVALTIYHIVAVSSVPAIGENGIVNWQTDTILNIGMAILVIGPWLASSVIFILEFIRSKFRLTKSLFLGVGFLLVCVGAVFQNSSGPLFTQFWYVFFSVILMVGWLFTLAGMFYEAENK